MKRINDRERIESYCREISILNELYSSISDYISLIEYDKGEFICHEGSDVNEFYFMIEGRAKVFTVQENGKILLLCFYTDFGLIGELELLSNVSYSTSVKTLSKVTCLSVDRNYFKMQLLANIDFVRYIAKSLSMKLLRNTQNCTFNMLYPLENRLATYILLSSENEYFVANLTYLSELLATSYRHLTRVLTRLCEDGILVKENSRYLILDCEKLKALSNKAVSSFGF